MPVQNSMTIAELKQAYKDELNQSFATQLKQASIKFKREVQFSDSRKWRFDFSIEQRKKPETKTIVAPILPILIDIQGGTWSGGAHVRGKGYENDVDKMNAATALGWQVYWFTGQQVKDGRAIAFVLDNILK